MPESRDGATQKNQIRPPLVNSETLNNMYNQAMLGIVVNSAIVPGVSDVGNVRLLVRSQTEWQGVPPMCSSLTVQIQAVSNPERIDNCLQEWQKNAYAMADIHL